MIFAMGKAKSIHDASYAAVIAVLASERKRLNISQREMGETLGLSQSDVSKIENLERRLDVLEFARMLKAFRVEDNPHLAARIRAFLDIA